VPFVVSTASIGVTAFRRSKIHTRRATRYRDRYANDPEIGRDVHYLVMISFGASVSQSLKRFDFMPNYGFRGFQAQG
jgi:hypothetical protein